METTGLINEMTLMLLNDAVDQLKHWQDNNRAISIGLNLSPVMLTNTDLPDLLLNKVTSRNMTPELLTLEITESSLIENTALALETLARLKINGFSLSIDDFGTGYSSMQQLNRVPFSELKIDRSFVHNACRDATQRAIIEANISLAQSLKMKTVAEGVETSEDWHLLKALNCHMAQGYFVGKPMPADALAAWRKSGWPGSPLGNSVDAMPCTNLIKPAYGGRTVWIPENKTSGQLSALSDRLVRLRTWRKSAGTAIHSHHPGHSFFLDCKLAKRKATAGGLPVTGGGYR